MKSFFIRKSDRRTCGRTYRIQLNKDQLVYDLLEESRTKLKFSEDAVLFAWLDEKVLLEKNCLESIKEFSTITVSEDDAIQDAKTNNSTRERKFVTVRVEYKNECGGLQTSKDAKISDLEENARIFFRIKDDIQISFKDQNGRPLDPRMTLAQLPDASTLKLHAIESSIGKSFKYWKKLDSNKPVERGKKDSKIDERKYEIETLRDELLDKYRNTLPDGISLEIINYFDDRITTFESEDYKSEEELHIKRTKENDNLAEKISKMTGEGLYDGIGFAAGIGLQRQISKSSKYEELDIEKTNEAIVSTTCFCHVKKFDVKPVLDEKSIVKTAKQIFTADNPIHRYQALDETIETIKKFKTETKSVPTVSFYCGGSFTIDASAKSLKSTRFSLLSEEALRKTDVYASSSVSGWAVDVGTEGKFRRESSKHVENEEQREAQNISVTFKQKSKPENCKSVSEVCEKLDLGVEYWAITPVINENVTYVQIDILNMMKSQANEKDDKILKDVADFLEEYLKCHTHFMVISKKQIFTEVFNKMGPRLSVPSTLLLPENTTSTFLTLEDVKEHKFHEGHQPMIIFMVRKKRLRRGKKNSNKNDNDNEYFLALNDEDIYLQLEDYLRHFESVNLNKIGLLIYDGEGGKTDHLESFRKKVQEKYGISNILVSECKNEIGVSNTLQKFLHGSEWSKEDRSYGEYKIEKVSRIFLHLEFQIFIFIFIFKFFFFRTWHQN